MAYGAVAAERRPLICQDSKDSSPSPQAMLLRPIGHQGHYTQVHSKQDQSDNTSYCIIYYQTLGDREIYLKVKVLKTQQRIDYAQTG